MVRLTDVLRFYKTEVRHLAFWHSRDPGDYRKRLALIYAVSVWSMIGFVGFMEWRKKGLFGNAKKGDISDDDTLSDLEEEPSQGRKQKITFSASIEYKENHVPYTRRIYEYFTSSNKTSNSGSAEN